MSFLRRFCFNPKVITTLIAIAVVVAVFAPDLVSQVIPLLILAACPLSMLVMGGGMMRDHHPSFEAERSQLEAASSKEVSSLCAEVKALRERIGTAQPFEESNALPSRGER